MDIQAQYTESDLLIHASTLYNGFLTVEKALTIFDMEYGFTPEIITDEEDVWIGYNEVTEQGNMPEGVTKEHLRFVKKLQEGGTVNMFMAAPEIQKCLHVERDLARSILSTYMKNYALLYDPASAV